MGRKRHSITRLFERAVVKRLWDSNTIDQSELVPNERLGPLFRAVCLSASHAGEAQPSCHALDFGLQGFNGVIGGIELNMN